ncbi:8-oxo-dGTP pyrophosphatase MutT (NUDIX family) [Bradyrhizobium sp. JR6.1]
MRELEEETGLTAADCRADADWHCIYTGVALAMMQILRVDMPADTLRARIESNLARQKNPELAGIHLVRSRADLNSAMPRFVTAFIETQLPA